MTAPQRPRATLKTYSHLASARRLPSDYDIASTQLLYYVGKGGFETDLPLGAWYASHQRGSRFQSSDWERFRDPRETTYTAWVTLQRDREAYVDRLVASMEESAGPVDPAWSGVIARALFPLRFALHGLQMVASYVGQMAPSGRVAIACAMQSADEVRRIQRIAYRMAVARRARPGVAEEAREAWQRGPEWQPMREAIERLLVVWDWGEAFVALSLAMKPWVDALVCVSFARAARGAGDALFSELLRSLGQDGAWHRAWARALVAVADGEASAGAIAEWAAKWRPIAERAASSLAPVFAVDPADLARDAAGGAEDRGAP